MHPLLYRRQFLLGPRPVGGLPDAWRRLTVAGGRTLHAHPDLLVTQRERGGVELTLLGFAVDPYHPARDDADVLDDLLDRAGRAADVLEQTDHLGGRWALVAVDADDALLFGDACGFRQAVYATDGGETWCASQPLLLGEAIDLVDDPEAVRGFVESRFFRRDKEGWWPGDRTRYAGVRTLLPNHVLDLAAGDARRFWPFAPLEPRSLESGVERGNAVLEGMMAAAHRRFPLTIALTAGIDSRMLLAPSRVIADEVPFFTHLHYGLDETHVDVVVPKKLSARLGFEHRVIDCVRPKAFSTSADPEVVAYRELYLANTSNSHLGWGSISYTLSREIPDDHVIVKANANPVTKGNYRRKVATEATDLDTLPEALAGYLNMGDNAFAAREFRRWAEASAEHAERYGYDLLDLFQQEQREGRWQAGDQLERDLDHETFVPFNSREYFSTLLGVHPKHRRTPPRRLHREMVRAAWPEALRVPINPVPLTSRLRAVARRVLVATGTLDPVKRLVRKSRSRL